MHDGYNVTDFEYLSMIKDNPKNSYEQMLILMYLQKNLVSIINGVKTNSNFMAFQLIFTENNQDQLTTIINKKIKQVQNRLKMKAKAGNEQESQYEARFNNFCQGINFRYFDFIPKLSVNADNFQYDQILNIQNLIITQIVQKLIQVNQLFIVSPFGEMTYQFTYQLICDILSTIMQTKVQIFILTNDNLDFIAQIKSEKVIVLLVNHSQLNEHSLYKLSNLMLTEGKAKFIHVLPGLVFTFSQKIIIEKSY